MISETENPSSKKKYLYWTLVVLAIIYGIQHAVSLWYINDDCFVSFRYARNFVNGLGLVYNAGERVEGFTNFLWTMIIALGMKFGFDPVSLSTNLGIIFYIATLATYGLMSWKFKDAGNTQLACIPLTTIALSLHREFNAHATSGMETSMFTFLITAAFALILLGTGRRQLIATGAVLVLAMMTRPDGIIFLAAAAFYIVVTRKPFLKSLIWLLLPSLIIFLPYWMIRYRYYGFFFPNTFYAKSIDLPYYSQGIAYALLYFKTYYVFAAIPILAGIILWQRRKKIVNLSALRSSIDGIRNCPTSSHPIILGLLCIVAYTAFTIRIGGDFMFARFFIATTPMMFFTIELLINKMTTKYFTLALYVLVILTTILRYDQYENDKFVGYVADESRYFTREGLQQAQTDGAFLRKYFDDLPVRVSFWAGQLRLVYYADPFYAIESSGGLTDTAVAHQAITTRGRPGHEKIPTTDYLIKRRINFYMGPLGPPPPGQQILNAILFGNRLGRIIVYNDTIMSALAKYPEVKFIRIPEYLDSYITTMDTLPRTKIESDYAYFKSFYFDINHDSADSLRQSKFVSYLQEK